MFATQVFEKFDVQCMETLIIWDRMDVTSVDVLLTGEARLQEEVQI